MYRSFLNRSALGILQEAPYKSDLLTWIKTTKTGEPAFGMGHYTRKNTETMIYGTRGKVLQRLDHSISQSLFSERREHSRKPDEAFAALEKVFGPPSTPWLGGMG
jgi:N6-adenosine-specific RNA methylase IME4